MKPEFIAYLTAGYPTLDKTLAAAKALEAGGVNILELGVPHSDPIADGSVIADAMQIALQQSVSFEDVLVLGRAIKAECNLTLVLFTYFNPIFQQVDVHERIRAAGFDAILVVDLPIEEGTSFYRECLEHDLVPILIVTPTTTIQRCEMMKPFAKRFIYFACQLGVTGVRNSLPDDFAEHIQRFRSVFDLPIVAGFGIANRSTAALALQHADGFVVGSRIISALTEFDSQAALTQFIQSIDPREILSCNSI